MESYIDCAWILLFATITVVRKLHERRAGGPRSLSGIPVVEMVLMAVWAILAAVAPFFFLFSERLAFADYPFDVPGHIRMVGAFLFLVAIWLMHASHRDLGEAWTPGPGPADGVELVTHGIYARMRHPMYASHLLWGIAQALILPNFLAGTGAIIPFAILMWLRIPREERALLTRFGDDYRAYASRTGRFWPKAASEESAPRG